MVIHWHTFLALPTVFRSQWLFQLTHGTVLLLHEEEVLIYLICFWVLIIRNTGWSPNLIPYFIWVTDHNTISALINCVLLLYWFNWFPTILVASNIQLLCVIGIREFKLIWVGSVLESVWLLVCGLAGLFLSGSVDELFKITEVTDMPDMRFLSTGLERLALHIEIKDLDLFLSNLFIKLWWHIFIRFHIPICCLIMLRVLVLIGIKGMLREGNSLLQLIKQLLPLDFLCGLVLLSRTWFRDRRYGLDFRCLPLMPTWFITLHSQEIQIIICP